MEGTVTALDKDGNVLLIGRFFDLNGRKALELSIRVLYGIQLYATQVAIAYGEENNVVESVGHGEDDYWLPHISDGHIDDTKLFI